MNSEMTDNLPQRVDVIEHKLDALSVSVDKRFDEVDRRFEQIDKRFEQIDKRFEQVDKRFEQVDKRFEQVDKRFDEVTVAIVEQREYTEFAFDRLRTEMVSRFDALEQRVATREQLERLERKFDRFVASQSRRPRRRPRDSKKR
jgi:chromosome segregation ATPase